MFETLPLWSTYIGIVAIILLSAWGGIRFAAWRKSRVGAEEDAPINTIAGASLALLAFILAFTFGLTITRFDARKQFLLEEVNSIETTWLRAGLITGPQKSDIQDALIKYVELRIEISEYPERIPEIVHQSEIIQRDLWASVSEIIANGERDDVLNGLLVESLNQVLDNHTSRVTMAVVDHIPAVFWLALFVLIILTMFIVGYLIGKMKRPNWYMILALSLAFSAVILLIVDLDRVTGTIEINQQPMIDLLKRINTQ